MLPPRPNPTFLTSSGLGFLPRHHSCFPALLNHKAGSTIARGRFWDFRNGFGSGIGIGNAGGLERHVYVRHASSSSSSTRWKSRQGKDAWAREAKVQGLKSRAAFKLLEVCMCVSLCVCGGGGLGEGIRGDLKGGEGRGGVLISYMDVDEVLDCRLIRSIRFSRGDRRWWIW